MVNAKVYSRVFEHRMSKTESKVGNQGKNFPPPPLRLRDKRRITQLISYLDNRPEPFTLGMRLRSPRHPLAVSSQVPNFWLVAGKFPPPTPWVARCHDQLTRAVIFGYPRECNLLRLSLTESSPMRQGLN